VGELLGQLLPPALGVAISPVPVIAAILMLLAPRAGGTSSGFLLGWVGGIAGVAVAVVVLAGVAGIGGTGGPSPAVSWISLGLGVLLVVLGVREWRGRPADGEPAPLPGWTAAVDTLTPVRAAGLGAALAAVNPKNLSMAVAAGVAVAGAALPAGPTALALGVFTVLAASTVAAPVLAHAVAADRMAEPLDALRRRLVQDNAAIMAVLLSVIGVVLIGKGAGGL
jgi:hypothetical protein